MIPQGPLVHLLALGLCAFAAPAAEPVHLAYDFSTTHTNGYLVTIESSGEFQPVALEGPLLIEIRGVDEIGTLFFHGRLRPRPIPHPARQQPMPRMGPFGFPRNPWLSFMQMMPSHNPQEAQVNAQGRILRLPRHLDLPHPVENYLTLFFPRLPQGTATEAQFETELIVDENAGSPHAMHFHHPGSPGNERFPGTRTERVSLADASDGTIRLQRTVEFQSYAKTGDQPRFAYSYQGVFLFDQKTGFLKSGQLEGSATTATLDFTHRIPVELRFEPLTGEEYQKALDQIPSLQPRVLDDQTFAQRIAELTGHDPGERREGALLLMNTEISPERATKLRPTIMPLLTDPEQMVRMAATRIFVGSATPEDVPLLLKMARQEESGQQFEVLQALGRLKDERAIQPLADMIASGSFQAHFAAQTLGEFGPIVEDTALQLLQEKHAETRRLACDILMRVGTAKSIEPLQKLSGNGDPNLIQNATTAIDVIRSRIEGPPRDPEPINAPDFLLDPNILL